MSLQSSKQKNSDHGNMDIPLNSKVKDVMIENVLTVDENTSVLDACQIMSKNKIGAVIVMSAILEAVGIFTERDLLNKIVSQKKSLDTKVKDVMTPDFDCLQLDDYLYDVPKIMVDGNYRHLPVVNGHEVVGIISVKDLLQYLIKEG